MWRIPFIAAVLISGLTSANCQTVPSEISAGVEAYTSAMYEQAVAHFQKAAELQPGLAVAHLYLAYCYAEMYIPGADAPDNASLGEKGVAEFKMVLAADPSVEQRAEALRRLASLLFNMKELEAAREYYEQLIELAPDDAEAYYTLAVIDWMETYTPRMDLQASMNVKPTEQITSISACAQLRSMNQTKVEDGIENLQRALEIRRDYDDAMAYINLLYREKAGYECDDPEQRAADLELADEWVDRTMQTKKAKADAAAAGRSKN